MLSLAVPALLVLALFAVVVVLLHSQQRRKKVVGSLRIWRELHSHTGSQRTRWHRPPLSLPLLLQVGAVLAIALAMAQPFWNRGNAPDHLIVVLDASAGMAVSDADGIPRLELARQAYEAQSKAIGALGPDRISLLVADPDVRVVAARWPWSPHALDGSFAHLEAADGSPGWSDLERHLRAIFREEEQTDIVFFSDRPAPAALHVSLPVSLTEVQIGTPRPRIAVDAEVLLVDAAQGRWNVSGTAAFLDGLQEATLTLSYSTSPTERPLPWDELVLDPDGEGSARFDQDVDLPGPGILSLVAPGPDRSEDMAWFILDDQSSEMDVLYLGEGGQPLLRALQAREGVNLFQAETLPADLSRFALVIVDNVTVPREPETNTVWIGGARVEWSAEPEILADSDADYWNARHPLAQNVNWSELLIGRAYAVAERDLADVILSAQGNPLIQAETGPYGRKVHLAFDPLDSNWPDQSSFAIFASALVDWTGARPGALRSTACTVGKPCVLDARLGGAFLVPADGRSDTRPLALSADGFLPRHAGLYQVSGNGNTTLVAVNSDALEPYARENGPSDGETFRLPQSWSVWLLSLAAVLVAADCIIAVRRKQGVSGSGVIGLAVVLAVLLSIFDVPAPIPQSREVMMIIGAGSSEAGELHRSGYTSPLIGGITGGAQPFVSDDPAEHAALSDGGAPALISHGEAALDLAATAIPHDHEGRILLVGEFATRPARLDSLVLDGIRVDHVRPTLPPAGEVTIHAVEVPQLAIADEPVPLIGLVHAQADTPATLTILLDGAVVAVEDVELAAGHNRVETILPGMASGESLIEIEISAPNDIFAENNQAGHIIIVRPARPIAIISPSQDHGDAFAALLESKGLDAIVMAPNRAPHYYSGFLEYSGVVLLNTPAIALTSRQQGLLRDAVFRHGLGLVILGGENSFGPGGYFETPLEEVSPLSSRIPRDAPQVAMVFVLDRSGSMQQPVGSGTRLDVAKHATLSAIELLNPESDIGIVVFDGQATTILPMQKVDRAAVESALSGVDPGGGTAIYPGLERAWEIIRDIDAPARHVVVMTDGLSQPGDWPAILSEMTAVNVTVSAVAIGQGSDRNTIETIAGLGGGSAHITTEFEALPSILSQEAMLLSAPIEEERRYPEWRDRDIPFLYGLPAAMPPIEGFVLTTAKPEARLALVTRDSEGEEAPLLALWRYGNGQVVAFTSDATGPWTQHWHEMDQYSALWADALRAFQPPTDPPGFSLRADGDGETLRLRLTALDQDGEPRENLDLAATIESPEGAVRSVRLGEDMPGIYRANIVLDALGRYGISVENSENDEALAFSAYHHSYEVSYDFSRQSGAAQWLANQTSGQVRTVEEALTAGAGLSWRWQGGWRAWALLGLGLFMIELFRRYGVLHRRGNT